MQRTLRRLRARLATCQRADSGMTLIETLAIVTILAVCVTMIALAGANGLRAQARAERSAIAANAQADILAKARAANFAELGFYRNQPGFTSTTNIDLPLRNASGNKLREKQVVLGNTAPASPPFDVKPVETFHDDEDDPTVAYRSTTWITEATGMSAAKRVTVRVEWTPLANKAKLDGTCTHKNVHCSIQTIVRAATGADQAGGTSSWSSSTCNTSTASVCETYVRSGRVLDGSSMVSSVDAPEQTQPVDFYARTTARAQSVTASWSQVVRTPAGSTTTINRTVNLQGSADGTRWNAVVPADERGATPKGTIRPGNVTVTFTARMPDGTNRTATVPAFWSVAVDQRGALAITPTSITGTCTAAGGTIRFQVTGHSPGLRTSNVPAAAADKVNVVFTQVLGGVTRTESRPATIVSAGPVNEVIAGTNVEVSARATWEVTAPATSNCGVTRHATVQVQRAIDHTTTNIPLTLEVS